MDKKARLSLFYQRLSDAPAAATHDEALKMLCDILNGVEDEYSNVVFNPSNWKTDGRMYPPDLDRAYSVDGFPEVIRYNSFRHDTFISSSGAIEVRVIKTNEIVFTKSDVDGKGVWA